MRFRAWFAIAVLGVLGACEPAARERASPSPPDPFVTNYGACFSRAALTEPWNPYQEADDLGTLSWRAPPWGFGFVAPLTAFGYGEVDGGVAQNKLLVRLHEFSTVDRRPESARDLVYDRDYRPAVGPSPLPGFDYFEQGGELQGLLVLFVSEDGRVAVDCIAPEIEPPNPTCTARVLGPREGMWIAINMPRRLLPDTPRLTQMALDLMASLEIPCARDASPTLRYGPSTVYLRDDQ